jgi:hypothetical protein
LIIGDEVLGGKVSEGWLFRVVQIADMRCDRRLIQTR